MMINTQPHQDTGTQSLVLIRALRSITSEQATTIVQAVHAAGDNVWDAQIVHDYDGYLSILVMPHAPVSQHVSYFVSGTAQNLELSKAYDDELMQIGRFNDANHLATQMLNLIVKQ